MDRRSLLPASPWWLRPRCFTKTETPTKTPLSKYSIPSFPAAPPTQSPKVVVDRDDQLRREYLSMPTQVQALVRRAHEQFGQTKVALPTLASVVISMFERGRMYDLYHARRNERLKRKKGEDKTVEEKKPWDLSVYSAAVKIKKGANRATAESVRRSVELSLIIARRSYSLRSSIGSGKEANKAWMLFMTSTKSTIRPVKGVSSRMCYRK